MVAIKTILFFVLISKYEKTSFEFLLSRFPVGSSANMIFVSVIEI